MRKFGELIELEPKQLGVSVPYQLKRTRRARRVRLAVHPDGRVVVTSPYFVRERAIERFVASKKEWVEEKVRFFKTVERPPVRRRTRKDYVENKERARALVTERTEFYAKAYGFSYNKIAIRNQKTRWGSCSKKGNLNINYKIVFLTPAQQDYLIVHELSHLKEFNHSRKFWALIASIIPDYQASRKALRRGVQ